MIFGPVAEFMVNSLGCKTLPDALMEACTREVFEVNSFRASTDMKGTSECSKFSG